MGYLSRMASKQRRALERLSKVEGFERFCLAGGGAVALHVGHRQSNDIDLFSISPDVDLDAFLGHVTRQIAECTVLSVTDASIRLLIGEVMVDVVAYPYPFEETSQGPGGVALASIEDLATMKLVAISRRGLRRDFWDLYVILKSGYTLKALSKSYQRRFGVSQPDLYHVMRALTYFDDAERDPVYPEGLSEHMWEEIKSFFRDESPKLLGERS